MSNITMSNITMSNINANNSFLLSNSNDEMEIRTPSPTHLNQRPPPIRVTPPKNELGIEKAWNGYKWVKYSTKHLVWVPVVPLKYSYTKSYPTQDPVGVDKYNPTKFIYNVMKQQEEYMFPELVESVRKNKGHSLKSKSSSSSSSSERKRKSRKHGKSRKSKK
jgi:hypothetical protein